MAPKKIPVCFVDSCVFVDLLTDNKTVSKGDKEMPRGELAELLFTQIYNGRIVLASSPLVAAEVGCHPGTDSVAIKVLKYLFDLLDHPSTRWTDIDRVLARKSPELVNEWKSRAFNGKMGVNDSLHLAAAIRLKADYFMTQDEGFPIGHEVEGVKIEFARPIGQGDLF